MNLEETIAVVEKVLNEDPPCDSCEVSCSKCDCYLYYVLHYLKEYKTILPLVPSLINTAIGVAQKGKTVG